jgi:hypothetical protein
MQTNNKYQAARAKLQPGRFGVPKTQQALLSQLQLLAFTAQRLERSFRLDALETKLQGVGVGVKDQAETGFQLYGAILETYAKTDKHRQRASNIRHCGQHYVVATDEEGPALLQLRCRDRMCLRCQMAKYRQIAEKTEARAAKMRFPKMLTLTLRQNEQTCDHEITRLLKCFARLRRHAKWKAEVRGGIYAVELVPRSDGRTHHVHLHAIIDCFFLDVRWISETWKEITGDSFQVDIKAPQKNKGSYIAKYAAKGANSLTEASNPWELADRLHGRRLIGTFGNVPALGKDDPEPKWQIVDTLPKMLQRAHAGDPEALDMLERAVERAQKENRSRGHPSPQP